MTKRQADFRSFLLVSMLWLFLSGLLSSLVSCVGDGLPGKDPTAQAQIDSKNVINALTAQVTTLQAQVATLDHQNTALATAYQDVMNTASAIDKAKLQNKVAATQASGTPAVKTLAEQFRTLIGASTSNADTEAKLKLAQADNAQLKADNAKLTADNKTANDASAGLQTQITALGGQITDLQTSLAKEKEAAAKELQHKLLVYFGWSLGLTIVGIAMAVWIPAPAKKIGYFVATIGATGIAITVFLDVWMWLFIWIVLGCFIAAAAFAAYSLYKTHGALTKTSQGIDGMRADLEALAAKVPEARQILTDWFGSKDQGVTGIFTWLHSEYAKIIANVRKVV
jgi:prefoldin subunit 5